MIINYIFRINIRPTFILQIHVLNLLLFRLFLINEEQNLERPASSRNQNQNQSESSWCRPTAGRWRHFPAC